MKFYLRLLSSALACVAVAIVVTCWLVGWDPAPVAPPLPYPPPDLATSPDPNAPPESSARVVLDPVAIDVFTLAAVVQFTDKVRDQGNLHEYRATIAPRGERAKARLNSDLSKRLDTIPL